MRCPSANSRACIVPASFVENESATARVRHCTAISATQGADVSEAGELPLLARAAAAAGAGEGSSGR